MRKGWMRATLAFGAAGVIVVSFAGAADAAPTVKARNDAATTTAGAPVTIRVTDNDDVSSGATTQTIDAPATTQNGRLAASGLTFTYTPNAGFTGIDRFSYNLCGTFPSGAYGAGDEHVCDEADVAVIVNADTSGVGAYGGGDVGAYGGGDVQGANTGSGGSLPTTGTGANLLLLLGIALVFGGVACYGATRDTSRALVR